jgi:hypothetical protein
MLQSRIKKGQISGNQAETRISTYFPQLSAVAIEGCAELRTQVN